MVDVYVVVVGGVWGYLMCVLMWCLVCVWWNLICLIVCSLNVCLMCVVCW